MNNQKITEGLTFLTTAKRITIVHGVLKSLGISPYRDDYDDFVQDAALIFAQAYATYPGDVTAPANERDLMCYAFRRMRWRILDTLRRQQHEKQTFTTSLDNDDPAANCDALLVDRQASNPFTYAVYQDLRDYLHQHCTPNQQRYLNAKLNHHLTDKEIALLYGVSRQAVHQWKCGVITRARDYRDKMKGKL